MRINDIGKHFMSAEFSKLAKTTKQVRESKLLEGTPGCADCEYMKDETDGMITTCDECAAEMNEAPTDQYTKPISRHLVKIDNMHSAMRRAVNQIHKMDDGDLTDQVVTMLKLLDKFEEVMQRSFAIIPESTESLDIKEDADVKAQYDELTDENQHGEAALLLAKTYGTELEEKLIKAIMDVHHARGNIMPEEQKLRDSIANKYYKQMMSDTFPANTSATQGKRMSAEQVAERDLSFAPDPYDLDRDENWDHESKMYDYYQKKYANTPKGKANKNRDYRMNKNPTKDAWINQYPDDVNDSGTGGPGATRRINMMKKLDMYDKDHGVKKRTVKTAGGKGPSSGPADPKVNTGPIKPIKRPNVPKSTQSTKSSWAQVLDFDVKKNKKKKESIGEDYTNMFGIQVRDIDDKIRDTEVQIDLAGRNQGGWKQSDIPKLESKLAHLKMKKSKGITEEAEKKPYICVHATKGKHECHAMSSYGAAKIAAEKWGLKSTSGIDCHLAVEEGVPGMAMPGMEPEKKICCKHCGDELYGKPETDCAYDINNPNQDNWILVDIDGDGDPDMKIAMGSMPEGWMDDAKDAAGSTLGKITNKVAGDFAKRKKLFGKSKAN